MVSSVQLGVSATSAPQRRLKEKKIVVDHRGIDEPLRHLFGPNAASLLQKLKEHAIEVYPMHGEDVRRIYYEVQDEKDEKKVEQVSIKNEGDMKGFLRAQKTNHNLRIIVDFSLPTTLSLVQRAKDAVDFVKRVCQAVVAVLLRHVPDILSAAVEAMKTAIPAAAKHAYELIRRHPKYTCCIVAGIVLVGVCICMGVSPVALLYKMCDTACQAAQWISHMIGELWNMTLPAQSSAVAPATQAPLLKIQCVLTDFAKTVV